MSPWPLGKPRSPEVKQRISETLKELHKTGKITSSMKGKPSPMRGKKHTEETKKKISMKIKKLMENPDFRRYATIGGKIRGKAMKGKPRPEWVRKKIGNSHRGKKYSEERIEKMRKIGLSLKDIKGHQGGPRHRRLVKEVASSLERDGNKVMVETSVKLEIGWRIPDILVDDKIWYEIGRCDQEKIEQLEKNGYEVIHMPYSHFEGGY